MVEFPCLLTILTLSIRVADFIFVHSIKRFNFTASVMSRAVPTKLDYTINVDSFAEPFVM